MTSRNVQAAERVKSPPARKAPAPASNAVQRLTFSIEEIAGMLGISRAGAYALAKKGDIPTIKLGGRVLVPRGVVDKLLAVETA
jgi:excisionase family DNA binding protein